MKYTGVVVRTPRDWRRFAVDAESETEARAKLVEAAKTHDWAGSHFYYDVVGVEAGDIDIDYYAKLKAKLKAKSKEEAV